MAQKLASGVTDSATSLSLANMVLFVQSVTFNNNPNGVATATANVEVFASAAAGSAGDQPVVTYQFSWANNSSAAPLSAFMSQLAANSGAEMPIFAAAYAALAALTGQSATLLAGSTLVGTTSV